MCEVSDREEITIYDLVVCHLGFRIVFLLLFIRGQLVAAVQHDLSSVFGLLYFLDRKGQMADTLLKHSLPNRKTDPT